MPHSTPAVQAGIALIITGMAAGSTATLASVHQVAAAFILTCCTPVIVYFWFFGEGFQIYWGLMGGVFMIGMIWASWNICQSLSRQIAVEGENARLQLSLFQETLAHAINQSQNTEEALAVCLKTVCSYLGWAVGHVYMVDEKDNSRIQETGLWYLDDEDRFQPLVEASRQLPTDISGTAIASVITERKPVWIDVTTNPGGMRRHSVGVACGLKFGFIFPIVSKTNVIAVMEFYTDQALQHQNTVAEMATPIGNQIGRTIERNRAAAVIENSEKRLQTIIENSVQGVLIHRGGIPLYVNEEASRIFDVARQDPLVMESTVSLVGGGGGGGGSEALNSEGGGLADLAREAASTQYLVRHTCGQKVSILARAVDIDWAQQPAVLITAIDVTALKKAQLDLERREKDLMASNEDLTLSRDQANAANLAKSEFLTTMSHELRTPLNAILGFSELARDQSDGSIKEYMSQVYDSGSHLLSLINDILDLAQIDAAAASVQSEHLYLEEVVGPVLMLLEQQAQQAGVTLALRLSPSASHVFADRRKLRQILINIVGNAIKFNIEGGSVTVASEANGEDVIVHIIDTGIGIAREDIPTALERFGQIDGSLIRQHSGTGLGLALSLAFMELHDGYLDLESEEGAGTTVTLRFPVEKIPDSSINAGLGI